jgi:hypothetical protein
MQRRRKPKSTVEKIEELRRNREERRRSADQFKRQRQQDKRRNEEMGRPGDIDFQRMIQNFRRTTKLKKRSHRPLDQNDPRANINICIRKRPVMAHEIKRKDWDAITCLHPLTLVHKCEHKVDGITKYLTNTEFSFDHSFDEKDDNECIYRCTARPLIPFVLDGGNATVFAYGQTGSGKTYTMTGMQEMTARDVFRTLEEEHPHEDLGVKVSFFEIYGGRCIDLLNKRSKLSIREDGRGNVVVGGIREQEVDTARQMLDVMQQGHAARATSKTEMNEVSSRSHAICRIDIFEKGGRSRGKFSLIDLAGSERASDTKNHNRQRRMEGAEINKSLLALKECIRALGASTHVPYRASKLTQVLKDSFSRKSKTVMICNISPGASAAEHTLNTLRYADRVKQKEVVHAYNMESTMPNIRAQMDAKEPTAHGGGGVAGDGAGAVNRRCPQPRATQRERDSPPPEAPMSPMGHKLKSVHAAAREGKISAEQKARFKEELINDHRNAAAAAAGRGSESKHQQHKSRPPRSGVGSGVSGADTKRSKVPVASDSRIGARPQWANRRAGAPSQTKENEQPSGRDRKPQAAAADKHRGVGGGARGRGSGGGRDMKTVAVASPPVDTPPKRKGGRRGGGVTAAPRAAPAAPIPSPHNKDLEIMHRSLRANRRGGDGDGGGSSAELQNLHEIVSELVEEEENLLHAHMESIQENAELLTEEGRLLAKVQGEDVVDYDIDMYAERLDEILSTKIRMYTSLHSNLKKFRKHLAKEEMLSNRLAGNVQMY